MYERIFLRSSYQQTINLLKVCIFKSLQNKMACELFLISKQRWYLSAFRYITKKILDLYLANFENIILLGDFNVDIKNCSMECFCESYGFKILIKNPTCLKTLENLTFLDLILTNTPFKAPTIQQQSFCETENGLSDFRKMIVTGHVLLKYFLKTKTWKCALQTL